MELLDKSFLLKASSKYALRDKGFDEPSLEHIGNWIKYLKRKKIGPTSITFSEFEAWCMKRLKVLDDKHEPVVIGYDILVYKENPHLNTFHVSISTLFLLELGQRLGICASTQLINSCGMGFPFF